MNVTITDVAKLAGVSPSTVSRVIADNPAISIKTKNKVRNAIEQLDYGGPETAQKPQRVDPGHAGFRQVLRRQAGDCQRFSGNGG